MPRSWKSRLKQTNPPELPLSPKSDTISSIFTETLQLRLNAFITQYSGELQYLFQLMILFTEHYSSKSKRFAKSL